MKALRSKTRHQLSCTHKHRRSSSKGFGRYTHSLVLRATNGRLGILVRATVFVPGNATHLNFKYCMHPLGSGRYKDWLHVADSLRHLSVSFPRLLENDSSSYFHVNHTTMSTHSNPFTQGGWSTSFGFNCDQKLNPPSVYGVLPMPTSTTATGSSKNGATHFQFTNPNPTILNSIVVGPHRDGTVHQLVRISTDERLAGYTTFTDVEGRSIALIEWTSGLPRVEVRSSVMKCSAGDWLKLNVDPDLGRYAENFECKDGQ